MFHRHSRSASEPSRSPLHLLAMVVRVLLLLTLAGMALLALSETPLIANWLAGAPPSSPLVGIVAGHWQNDSGAICPDGLQEVELNLEFARRVSELLRQQGYRAEVLPEYSPKLNGYEAAVFISIHCDSCTVSKSGFKVARMTHSDAPEVEDRLVELLSQQYSQATGLAFDADTITDDMRRYHGLRRIAPGTPGAIIECGFMSADRHLLENEPDRVAVGIANGLLAFLRQQGVTASPTP